jgi:hypothetical protein
MCSKLALYDNINEPNYKLKEVIIQSAPYIGNWFFTSILYDKNNIKIGYKSGNVYVQEDSNGKYLARHFTTYYIIGKGSISWQYANINDQPNANYPLGIVIKARITSGTGDYVNANGCVKLTPKADGGRVYSYFIQILIFK